jgi:hypothetical protein
MEDSIKRKDRITEEEFEFLDNLNAIDFYIDGDKCTWDSDTPNAIGITILTCTPDELQRIIDIDIKLHHDLDGYSTADDITDAVLFDLHDCEQYGFASDSIEYMFYDWRKSYLTEDDVLDKITMFGIESLTQHEKDFLDTGELKAPWYFEEF